MPKIQYWSFDLYGNFGFKRNQEGIEKMYYLKLKRNISKKEYET